MSIKTFDVVGTIHGREYAEWGEYVSAVDYRELKLENESLRNAYEAGIKHSDEAASKYIDEHWRPIRKELDDCADSLPGSYYMDPPDGGDASISVQVSRMAEDAKRYRWLRDKGSLLGAIDYACMGWKDGEIDRAIDNLMCSPENH